MKQANANFRVASLDNQLAKQICKENHPENKQKNSANSINLENPLNSVTMCLTALACSDPI
jgi:hypothetical protein